MAVRLGSLFRMSIGQNLKFLSFFVSFCPIMPLLSDGLDNGATSFIPLHRESDKDSCNLLTDHIKQNVKRNKKRYVYQFFDYSMEIQIFSNSKFGQLRVALNEKGKRCSVSRMCARRWPLVIRATLNENLTEQPSIQSRYA